MVLKRDSSYPRLVSLGDIEVELDHMDSGDLRGLMRFADRLSEHDLLFLRRDIRQLEVLEDWLMQIDAGEVLTILAKLAGEVVGYATVQRNRLRWSQHVGELRVLISESVRGKGLGAMMTREALRLATRSGIEKMMARMTVDQKGAISVFEGLGFHQEARLVDHVKDLEGRAHDLMVMSRRIDPRSDDDESGPARAQG